MDALDFTDFVNVTALSTLFKEKANNGVLTKDSFIQVFPSASRAVFGWIRFGECDLEVSVFPLVQFGRVGPRAVIAICE